MNNVGIARYAKTVVAFITPGIVATGVAIQDGSDGGSSITQSEWITILLAMFVTAGVVFGVPNKTADQPDYDPKHDTEQL